MNDKNYLIIFDFLYQKFEIEYENNMSPQEVIRKVQQYLFPGEKNNDLISDLNEESCEKFCLYRSNSNGLKGATFVSWNITLEECDHEKYQFYLYRPLINVYLSIYIVLPNELEKYQSKAYLNIIYPIKKKVVLFKKYLKERVIEYTRDKAEFKDNPINGFTLRFVDNLCELDDNEYIEKWMNGKEIFLVIQHENNIAQGIYAPDKFYYIAFDPSKEVLIQETDSLEFECNVGFRLNDAKRKLIEKHQNGNNFQEDKVIILFNSIVQTEKFDRLDDLYSDNHFYRFVVIFESDIQITNKPQTFSNVNKSTINYKISIPKEGRPNIINFQIAGEPKRELANLSMNFNVDQLYDADNDNSDSNTSSTDDFDDDINYNSNAINNQEIQNQTQNITLNNNNEENKTNKEILNKEDNYIEEVNNDNNNSLEIDINSEFQSDEKILDLFCYYFKEYMKEKRKEIYLTPTPGHFGNLSGEEKTLLQIFRKYFIQYRQEKQ